MPREREFSCEASGAGPEHEPGLWAEARARAPALRIAGVRSWPEQSTGWSAGQESGAPLRRHRAALQSGTGPCVSLCPAAGGRSPSLLSEGLSRAPAR